MDPETSLSYGQPQPAGILPADEKQLLIGQMQSTLKMYNYCLIFSWISILIIAGVILVPALYIAKKNAQKKLNSILNSDLQVYKVSGILTKKSGGKSIIILSVGSFTLPEISNGSVVSKFKDLIGQPVTAEYVSEASKNRCLYDAQGSGYNFITKSTLPS